MLQLVLKSKDTRFRDYTGDDTPKRVLFSSEMYSIVDSFDRGAKLEPGQICLSLDDPTIVICCKTHVEIINCLRFSFEEWFAKFKNTFEFKLPQSLNKSKPSATEVVQSCEVADYLSSILRKCPEVSVIKPKLKTVKQYLRELHKDAVLLDNGEVENPRVAHLKLAKKISAIGSLRLMHNDSKALAQNFRYPTTQKQFNALCLMQAYTNAFSSCQYLPLHEMSLDDVKAYVNNYFINKSLSLIIENSEYFDDQDLDFCTGYIDRFFTLDDKGFVNKRFSIYRTKEGDISIDNFYNCSARTTLKIGNTFVTSTKSCFYRGRTYQNSTEKFSELELPL